MKKVFLTSWRCILNVNLIISLVLEQQGARKMQNYHSKVKREDMIAQGARAGLERRRREQFEARKNSIKNRKTSKVPMKCLCFNS